MRQLISSFVGFLFFIHIEGFCIFIGMLDTSRLVKSLQDAFQCITRLSLASWIPRIVMLFEVALFHLGSATEGVFCSAFGNFDICCAS